MFSYGQRSPQVCHSMEYEISSACQRHLTKYDYEHLAKQLVWCKKYVEKMMWYFQKYGVSKKDLLQKMSKHSTEDMTMDRPHPRDHIHWIYSNIIL